MRSVGQASRPERDLRSRPKQSGFTLIELLIAITLVAAISTGMLYAMRVGLLTLQKVDDRLQSNRRVVSVEQILSRQMEGVMPVTGDCRNAAGGAIPRVPAFNGNDQTLHLVTSYSMTEGSRGAPRILELQVVNSDRGGFRLIVNESLYTGPSSLAPFCFERAFLPAQVRPDSFILADRLAYCHIAYQETRPEAPNQQRWLLVWDKPNLPSAVHFDMAPLVADPATLPLLSVTVPIHITREVLNPYADAQ